MRGHIEGTDNKSGNYTTFSRILNQCFPTMRLILLQRYRDAFALGYVFLNFGDHTQIFHRKPEVSKIFTDLTSRGT